MSKKKQFKKNRKNKKGNRNNGTIKKLFLSSFVWIVILLVGEIIIKLPYIEDFINWIIKLLSFNYQ